MKEAFALLQDRALDFFLEEAVGFTLEEVVVPALQKEMVFIQVEAWILLLEKALV